MVSYGVNEYIYKTQNSKSCVLPCILKDVLALGCAPCCRDRCAASRLLTETI